MIEKKAETYRILVEKLIDKCQKVQVENERCVMRVNSIKKLTRRRARDVELLKQRLDKHQDNWRSVPMVAPHPKRKIEQKRGPKPKNKQVTTAEDGGGGVGVNKEKKVRKQRVKKESLLDSSMQQPQQQQMMPEQLQQQQQIQIQEEQIPQQQQILIKPETLT